MKVFNFQPLVSLRSGLFLFLFLSALSLFGQFKFREIPSRSDPQKLDLRESSEVWEAFMSQRALGRFEMRGQLTHRKPGEPSSRYELIFRGDWSDSEQACHLLLIDVSGEVLEREITLGPDGPIDPVSPLPEDEAPFQSTSRIFPSLPLTWFELTMPFLQWASFQYIGPERYLGRPAHAFRARNPDANASPSEVALTLDEDFAALLKVNTYDASGKRARSMRVGGFRKYGDIWMASEFIWEHRKERSSVRYEVSHFTLLP